MPEGEEKLRVLRQVSFILIPEIKTNYMELKVHLEIMLWKLTS